ncbi:MAG TPA: HAD family hydrolase, partial [Thermoleophilia bacterium]|nr:HAD family hydrolase [Thermoleophilia bacterium]
EQSVATVDACYEEMLADYGEHCLVKTRPYAGVAELLEQLRARGLPLAVFSNKADVFTQRLAAALFPAGTFAVVLGARPDLPLKPDPAGALLIARRLGVEPAETVYLGDSGTDMTTATAAAMIAVGVTWGFRSPDELLENGAVALLDRPAQLLELASAWSVG